jgi:UDP-2,3-diacylglucosamine hydrolase
VTVPTEGTGAAPRPSARCLFVSDVHLDAGAPGIEARFLSFLRDEATGSSALYILGDLFETWIGDDDTAPDKEAIRGALRELTACGVACFLLHGNRDFLLGRRFCEQTGCRLLSDPVVVELGGERVLLTHGDALCTDDHAYQQLRSVVRSANWQRRFLSLPLAQRRLLAGEARAGSRAHLARAQPEIMDVNPRAVAAAFEATRTRRMIHGHTHRPAVHDLTLGGESLQRIVLGAWHEHGSCLVFEAGRYQLRQLRG